METFKIFYVFQLRRVKNEFDRNFQENCKSRAVLTGDCKCIARERRRLIDCSPPSIVPSHPSVLLLCRIVRHCDPIHIYIKIYVVKSSAMPIMITLRRSTVYLII